MSPNPTNPEELLEQSTGQEKDQWLQALMEELTAALDDIETQIKVVEESGWDEAYGERVIRDIKAAGYNVLFVISARLLETS